MCKTKSGKLISGGEGRWDPNKKGGPTKNPKINKLGGGEDIIWNWRVGFSINLRKWNS